MKIQYGRHNMAAISISSGSNANIVAAILDFMKTSNTKNVCIYIIDQHVKFHGIGLAAILDFKHISATGIFSGS